MRIIIFIATLIFPLLTFGQLKLPVFKDTTALHHRIKNYVVDSLLSKNQLLVLFSTTSSWHYGDDVYQVIQYSSDNHWHSGIIQDKSSTGAGKRNYTKVQLPEETIKAIWNTLLTNDLLSIKKENTWEKYCKRTVYDSHYYHFHIITKKQYKFINYFDPEFYEKNCEKNQDRERVINCANTFKKAFASR